MMIDGRAGAQIETIKLWRDLDRRNKPRFVFINRCDDERTDFKAVVKDIHDKFNVEVCPITIPMGAGPNYKGVIDVLKGKAYTAAGGKETEGDIPAEFQDDYQSALEILAGSAAEGDDDLLVKFIDEGTLTPEEIAKGLSIAFANNRIVPAFAGSVLGDSGLTSVLDFIISTAPSPEGFIDTVKNAEGETEAIKVDPALPMTAVVVKTSSDQFSGRMSYIKIVTGSFKADTEYFNIREGKKEKIGKLYRLVGKKLEEIKSANAGDIVVATKLAFTQTSDTLSENANALPFVKLRHPEPVFSMAVSAGEKKEED